GGDRISTGKGQIGCEAVRQNEIADFTLPVSSSATASKRVNEPAVPSGRFRPRIGQSLARNMQKCDFNNSAIDRAAFAPDDVVHLPPLGSRRLDNVGRTRPRWIVSLESGRQRFRSVTSAGR